MFRCIQRKKTTRFKSAAILVQFFNQKHNLSLTLNNCFELFKRSLLYNLNHAFNCQIEIL